MNAARQGPTGTSRRSIGWTVRTRKNRLTEPAFSAAPNSWPTAPRATAAIGLTAIGMTALLAVGTTAAASTAPYAITDIGEAPTAGFRVSDIGAVPTAEDATPPDDAPHTAGLAVSDIGPVTITDERTGGPVTADTDSLGSSPAAVYPGQMVSVPG